MSFSIEKLQIGILIILDTFVFHSFVLYVSANLSSKISLNISTCFFAFAFYVWVSQKSLFDRKELKKMMPTLKMGRQR